ncbi:NSF attachment protein like protein [Aduncisulcus paluster]|uniref:Gamma-soluble NSF attachment protein n=1 Tax=Aduncisulcus paluster TaxID=2918883 RepID=A0ABQ5K3C4_9EUKA|nr:NSF attachment protein like protein [Aduncisulcus paluster]
MADVKQAEKFLKSAEKAMKTGIFKKAHPEEAANYYEKAARIYKGLRQFDKVALYYEKAAECLDKVDLSKGAGRAYKQAADLYITKLEKADKAHDLVILCCERLVEGGDIAAAADYCKNIGQKLMQADNMKGFHLARKSAEYYELNERPIYAINPVSDACDFLMVKGMLPDAIEELEHLIRLYEEVKQERNLDGVNLVRVIVHLMQNDIVAAENVFFNFYQHSSDEAEAAELLIKAYKERDEDLLKEAKKHSAFRFVFYGARQLLEKMHIGSTRRRKEALGLEEEGGITPLVAAQMAQKERKEKRRKKEQKPIVVEIEEEKEEKEEKEEEEGERKEEKEEEEGERKEEKEEEKEEKKEESEEKKEESEEKKEEKEEKIEEEETKRTAQMAQKERKEKRRKKEQKPIVVEIEEEKEEKEEKEEEEGERKEEKEEEEGERKEEKEEEKEEKKEESEEKKEESEEKKEEKEEKIEEEETKRSVTSKKPLDQKNLSEEDSYEGSDDSVC